MASIYLGFVNPGSVKTVFMLSVLGMVGSPHAITIRGEGSGPLIARARNDLIQRYLSDTTADYFWSIDSDIQFLPGILDQLLEADKPIISAHYRGKDASGAVFPVANVRDPKTGLLQKATYKQLESAKYDVRGRPITKKSGLIEVSAVGMGCTLIQREVLEKLGTGILWPFAEMLTPEGQALGEDVTFCVRAGELGYKSYLLLDAKVDHLKHAFI